MSSTIFSICSVGAGCPRALEAAWKNVLRIVVTSIRSSVIGPSLPLLFSVVGFLSGLGASLGEAFLFFWALFLVFFLGRLGWVLGALSIGTICCVVGGIALVLVCVAGATSLVDSLGVVFLVVCLFIASAYVLPVEAVDAAGVCLTGVGLALVVPAVLRCWILLILSLHLEYQA